jgi:hypothetical protein
MLKAIGVKVTRAAPKTWADIANLVNTNKSPVVFGFKHAGGKHIMTAFKRGSQIVVADQHGIHAEIFIQSELVKPGAALVDAVLIEDSAFVATAEALAGGAVGVQATQSEDMRWLEEQLFVSAWVVADEVVQDIATAVRRKLRGDPPDGILSPSARAVLAALPPGAMLNGLMAQVGSGLPNDAFMAAVAELETRKRIRVVWKPCNGSTSPEDPSNILQLGRI